MAFPNKKPDLTMILGIGKRKPGQDAPPSFGKPKADVAETPDTPEEETAEGESGITPEEVDYSSNDLCDTCANMSPDGQCAKYHFAVDKSGHCAGGYEPKADGSPQETEEGAGDLGGLA